MKPWSRGGRVPSFRGGIGLYRFFSRPQGASPSFTPVRWRVVASHLAAGAAVAAGPARSPTRVFCSSYR